VRFETLRRRVFYQLRYSQPDYGTGLLSIDEGRTSIQHLPARNITYS
jgi:hypothetical protein